MVAASGGSALLSCSLPRPLCPAPFPSPSFSPSPCPCPALSLSRRCPRLVPPGRKRGGGVRTRSSLGKPRTPPFSRQTWDTPIFEVNMTDLWGCPRFVSISNDQGQRRASNRFQQTPTPNIEPHTPHSTPHTPNLRPPTPTPPTNTPQTPNTTPHIPNTKAASGQSVSTVRFRQGG